jgi:hypothetical protein
MAWATSSGLLLFMTRFTSRIKSARRRTRAHSQTAGDHEDMSHISIVTVYNMTCLVATRSSYVYYERGIDCSLINRHFEQGNAPNDLA